MEIFHPGFKVGSVKKFRREKQDPPADAQVFAIVFLAADLARLYGNDGTLCSIEHLHSVGKVLRKVPLDEKSVDAVSVQAGADRRHFIIMDDAHQRMQHRSAHGKGVNIGIGDVQDILHYT